MLIRKLREVLMKRLLIILSVFLFSSAFAEETVPELEIPVKCPFEDITGTKYVGVIYKLNNGKYTFSCMTGKKLNSNLLFSSSEEAYKAIFDKCI